MAEIPPNEKGYLVFCCIMGAAFLAGLLLGVLFSENQATKRPTLCPAPYETLLTQDGVRCRTAPEPPQPNFYVVSADSGITYNCTGKPTIYVNMGAYQDAAR